MASKEQRITQLVSALYAAFVCVFSGDLNAQIFTLVENEDIVNDSSYSEGAIWGDYNNDNFIDLFVPNSWNWDNNFLYLNDQNGSFSKIYIGEIVSDVLNSNGASWGDYNNDGFLDLIIANANDSANHLFYNNGNETFTRVSDMAISNDKNWSFSAAWGDYDNDGWLDLYISNYHDQKNILYKNNGDGSFVKVDSTIIDSEYAYSINAVWADLNNDFFVDLCVANNGLNFMYKNNGNGTFTKISNNSFTQETANSYGCSIADYNNDGLLDIFVANWDGLNFLYKNNGNFTFVKITDGDIVNDYNNSEGSTWGDYDNDGFIDLFVANDGNNSLYHNNGDETFDLIISGDIVNDGANSNGSAWADIDNDN